MYVCSNKSSSIPTVSGTPRLRCVVQAVAAGERLPHPVQLVSAAVRNRFREGSWHGDVGGVVLAVWSGTTVAVGRYGAGGGGGRHCVMGGPAAHRGRFGRVDELVVHGDEVFR